jgi:hypothetical protein
MGSDETAGLSPAETTAPAAAQPNTHRAAPVNAHRGCAGRELDVLDRR